MRPDPAGLALGISFYQVFLPQAVVAANGDQQYAVVGPFQTLADATAYAATRPGALITVTLVLHASAATIPAKAPAPLRN